MVGGGWYLPIDPSLNLGQFLLSSDEEWTKSGEGELARLPGENTIDL